MSDDNPSTQWFMKLCLYPDSCGFESRGLQSNHITAGPITLIAPGVLDVG